ncbi:transposase [Streptomyces sp. NPDC056785]|uniref:transposase n=1 Tax=Streptomyces sp. NPDC056785 TaxID=3345944 RepID=UPI0036B4DC89
MLIEPLLPPWPERSPVPRPVADRLCLQGILYVLHNDVAWQLLPLELGFGCAQSCRSSPARHPRTSRAWAISATSSSRPSPCSTSSNTSPSAGNAEPNSTAPSSHWPAVPSAGGDVGSSRKADRCQVGPGPSGLLHSVGTLRIQGEVGGDDRGSRAVESSAPAAQRNWLWCPLGRADRSGDRCRDREGMDCL